MSPLLLSLCRWWRGHRQAPRARTAQPQLESLEERRVPTVGIAGPILPALVGPLNAATTATITAKDVKAPAVAAGLTQAATSQAASPAETTHGGQHLGGERSIESSGSLAPAFLGGRSAFFASPFVGGLHFGAGGGHGGHHHGGGDRQSQSLRQDHRGNLDAEEEAMGNSAADALFSSHGADLQSDHATGSWLSAVLLSKGSSTAADQPLAESDADREQHLERSGDGAALTARAGQGNAGQAGRNAKPHLAVLGANPLLQHQAGDPVGRLEQVRPGDVLQFHNLHDAASPAGDAASRSPQTLSPQRRLAIVERNLGGGRFRVLQQTHGTQLPLTEETIDLSDMTRGGVQIYRPDSR